MLCIYISQKFIIKGFSKHTRSSHARLLHFAQCLTKTITEYTNKCAARVGGMPEGASSRYDVAAAAASGDDDALRACV